MKRHGLVVLGLRTLKRAGVPRGTQLVTLSYVLDVWLSVLTVNKPTTG